MGAPGCGKSSVVAYWMLQLFDTHCSGSRAPVAKDHDIDNVSELSEDDDDEDDDGHVSARPLSVPVDRDADSAVTVPEPESNVGRRQMPLSCCRGAASLVPLPLTSRRRCCGLQRCRSC